jgi:hypothetical protein
MGRTAREKDGQQKRHFRQGEPKRAATPEPGRAAHGSGRGASLTNSHLHSLS